MIGLQFHLETTMETTELMIEIALTILLMGDMSRAWMPCVRQLAVNDNLANRLVYAILDYLTIKLGQETEVS